MTFTPVNYEFDAPDFLTNKWIQRDPSTVLYQLMSADDNVTTFTVTDNPKAQLKGPVDRSFAFRFSSGLTVIRVPVYTSNNEKGGVDTYNLFNSYVSPIVASFGKNPSDFKFIDVAMSAANGRKAKKDGELHNQTMTFADAQGTETTEEGCAQFKFETYHQETISSHNSNFSGQDIWGKRSARARSAVAAREAFRARGLFGKKKSVTVTSYRYATAIVRPSDGQMTVTTTAFSTQAGRFHGFVLYVTIFGIC